MQEACSTSQAERDAQEESQELSAKVQHLVGLPDGEAVPQSILLVQVLQQLAVHAVLDGVHHLRFGQHRPPLLLYTVVQKLWVEGDLGQGIQYLQSTSQASIQMSLWCVGHLMPCSMMRCAWNFSMIL